MKIDFNHLISQKRFQPPADWNWISHTIDNVIIRYGQSHSHKTYDAVCVIVGGLGDFGEQYFEIANHLDAHAIKPIIIDMPGQGGSSRYIPDQPMKRHSDGFDKLLSQMHHIFDEVVLPSAIDINDHRKRLPIVLLAHSMAGNIAIRYLSEYNKSVDGTPIFACAAITAPMLDMRAVNAFPPAFRLPIVRFLALQPTAYVPGGSDWYDGYRERPGFKGIFTSDPERYELQRAYFTHPDFKYLATGSPTRKWLFDAFTSCNKIKDSGYLEKIETPILVAIAGKDQLVVNATTRNAAKRLKFGELLEIDGAQHEILMESDCYRTPFVERFFTFLEENVLNKPDKGKTTIL
jgi:lysophospholipase